MKVLFIFHTPWLKGGASKSGLTLVKGLKDRDVEVVALCPAEGELSEALRKNGIEVRVFGYEWAYPYFQRTPAGVLKFLPKLMLQRIRNRKALRRMLGFAREYAPDVVHTNSGVADSGLKIAKALGLPHVTHFREFGWKDCSAIMWHERGMSGYPRQHAIAIGKEMLDFHSRGGSDIRLIYNGIVPSGALRLSEIKDPWILYVGGLYKEKGIEDMLKAYAMLPADLRESHRLKIAGTAMDNGFAGFLKSLADELEISDTIDWLGERDDVADLMLRARLLVVPSHHEAFGRIVVEAMANGCPVVGRDSDGVKEQFDNGLHLTGDEIGVRFSSVEQLSDILREELGKDARESLPMLKRAQTAVENLYSVEGYVDKVIEYYQDIAKQ